MGKLIFWIVVVFIVLFALRLVNVSKAKRRGGAAGDDTKKAGTPAETMVRCASCGVFLPQGDARPVAGGFVCGEPGCVGRR